MRRHEAARLREHLTGREREIAALAFQGLSNEEIVRKFGIAEGTVNIHLNNVCATLDVMNRAALQSRIVTYVDIW